MNDNEEAKQVLNVARNAVKSVNEEYANTNNQQPKHRYYQPKFQRGNYRLVINQIYKPQYSQYAHQFRYYSNYLKYRNYRYSTGDTRNREKREAEHVKKITEPFRNECSLSLRVHQLNHNQSFLVHAYSGSRYSDLNVTDNLPKFIQDNFKVGNVINAKLVRTRNNLMLTSIKKLKNTEPVKVTMDKIPTALQPRDSEKPANN